MTPFPKSTHALIVFLLALSLSYVGAPQAGEFETRTNREGSVTVKVTPGDLSLTAASWDFEVTLSSHVTELDQDMQSVAALVVGPGNVRSAFAWEGDPPGGHHRKGVLRFQPPKESPGVAELHLNGIGGASQRVFRWTIGE
jgi:hypothetical protein